MVWLCNLPVICNVEFWTVALPVSCGCHYSPQYLLRCYGLPYVVIVVVFFIFWGWESVHFTHRLEVYIFLFLSVVYVCFPSSFVAQDRLCLFPCCERCSLISFWDCCFPHVH